MIFDETHKKSHNLIVEVGIMITNAVQDGTITRIQAIGILESIKAQILFEACKATLE